jgi:hypothetical protein
MNNHSRLADVTFESFSHNNMVPFFGSGIKQNLNENVNETLLSKYTGYDDIKIEKSEQSCFADIHKNVYNNDSAYIEEIKRFEKPVFHNNILPTEQIKVGPGDYTTDLSEPSGGYQQDGFREFEMYKNIDDMRVKTNPKQTYDARIVNGMKEQKLGKTGKFEKNRVDTFYEKTEDDLFKTTSHIKKDTYRSCIDIKETNRKDNVEYKGIPYTNKGLPQYGKIKQSNKKENSNTDINRNTSIAYYGNGNKDDFGKKNILVYDNERNVSSTSTYEGNITSYVKSMIAPVTDMFRRTNKEFFIRNPREFGQLQTTYPKKPTIYEPNQVMKTTIKETLIHDNNNGNLKGHEQITTYDPNDVARTTIKETTIHDASTGNMKLKPKSIVYDPFDITKTTGRQTLNNEDHTINIKGHKKQTIYDPNDTLRTTIKETTIDNDHIGGVSTLQNSTGYLSNKYTAKHTAKEIISDNEYIGNPENENGDGYKNANFDAKNTNKQFTSDNEYFGNINSEQDAAMSYDDIYNAIINDTKEKLLNKPPPTQSGVKLNKGVDDMFLTNVKTNCNIEDTNTISKIYQNIPSKEFINNTSNKREPRVNNCNNDRLDPILVDAFKSNPYTHPLTNAV